MTDHDINRVLAEKVMGWPVIDDDEPFARHAHKGGVITSDGPGVIRRGIIPQSWSPTTNRNDLAEVLATLTEQQWTFVVNALGDYWFKHKTPNSGHGPVWFFMTCDPRIIATAVAEVVAQSKM